MIIELIEDTNLGNVKLLNGDRIITNGFRLWCKSIDLTEADPAAFSTDGKPHDPNLRRVSYMEAQSFDPKDFEGKN